MTHSFAIVPAAGRSSRMGTPKLLLPWGNTTVIEHVLSVWQASGVSQVMVTVHPDDHQLAELCRRSKAEVVVPSVPPPDMKASILAALDSVEERFSPSPDDVWLVAPADIPNLSASVINRLLATHRPDRPRILVPTHHGRRGHPVLLPWALAAEVAQLPEGSGIDLLFTRHSVEEIDSPPEAVAPDLDTPEDYRRLRKHE